MHARQLSLPYLHVASLAARVDDSGEGVDVRGWEGGMVLRGKERKRRDKSEEQEVKEKAVRMPLVYRRQRGEGGRGSGGEGLVG